MTIDFDTTKPEEVILFDRLYSFLMQQPNVKSLRSSWFGPHERCVITTKEPKSHV